MLIQLFLVSRIFQWVGIAGALIVLPVISLGRIRPAPFGASLGLMKWIKSVENGTDYSLMNTTKAALFLKTTREEKYKAKAAIETFFVRGGDTLPAVAVFLGTTFLAARSSICLSQRGHGHRLDPAHRSRVREYKKIKGAESRGLTARSGC